MSVSNSLDNIAWQKLLEIVSLSSISKSQEEKLTPIIWTLIQNIYKEFEKDLNISYCDIGTQTETMDSIGFSKDNNPAYLERFTAYCPIQFQESMKKIKKEEESLSSELTEKYQNIIPGLWHSIEKQNNILFSAEQQIVHLANSFRSDTKDPDDEKKSLATSNVSSLRSVGQVKTDKHYVRECSIAGCNFIVERTKKSNFRSHFKKYHPGSKPLFRHYVTIMTKQELKDRKKKRF